jgi:hypothetical protein
VVPDRSVDPADADPKTCLDLQRGDAIHDQAVAGAGIDPQYGDAHYRDEADQRPGDRATEATRPCGRR